jgi:hypothetical protein
MLEVHGAVVDFGFQDMGTEAMLKMLMAGDDDGLGCKLRSCRK